MPGRRRSDFSRNTAQSFLNQLFQRPAGAVACQHRQIMNMQKSIAMGIGNLLIINFRQPVIGRNGSAIAQDQPTYRIGYCRVFFYPPVGHIQITIHQILIVQNSGLHIANFFPLLAIQNIGFGNICIACLNQHSLHTVLNILHLNPVIFNFWLKIRCHLQCQQINDAGMILLFLGFKSSGNRLADFSNIKICHRAVSLHHCIHLNTPVSTFSLLIFYLP